MNWYNIVSRNLDKIPECIAYFDKELIEAKKQCKLAVKESIDDNPSKVRHAPFSYEIYEAVDCKT